MEAEVILELKPKFINWVRICSILCSPGCISILLIIICCGIPFSALIEELLHIPLVTIIPLIFVLFLFGLSIALFCDKKNYEATNYKIYEDRIEFEEGFINHKYTTIRMSDIKEIHLDQNFIQRMAGLGTIRFITAANNSTTSTGVCFRDLQNSIAVYAEVDGRL